MRQIFAAAVAFLFAWPILMALQTGRINLKGGMVRKSDHPFTYWSVLVVGVALVLALIVVGYQVLPAGFPNWNALRLPD